MNASRNMLTKRWVATTAAVVIVAVNVAQACLRGTWLVQCPYDKQVDQVDGVTCQHKCSKCDRQVFSGPNLTDVTVVCPKGHSHLLKDTGKKDQMGKWVQSFKCPTDGLECRIDKEEKPRSNPTDRGGR
jgi:hypothetical protein